MSFDDTNRNFGGVIIGRPRVAARGRRSSRRVQPPTVTTTVEPQGSGGSTTSVTVDISVNPFIRNSPIQFVAHSLRPQRAINYFFDGANVSTYVQRASVLRIDGTNPSFIDTLGVSDQITYLGNSATVLENMIDVDSGNTVLFLANVVGNFPVGVTITGSRSGATALVNRYDHRHGTTPSAGAANSIALAADASSTTGFYIGNTIYLCSGTGANQFGLITQYDGATRIANVQTNWTTIPVANSTRYSIGNHAVERNGSVAGIFNIPNNPSLRIRTGERLFRITDTGNGEIETATCRADFRFVATGTTQVINQVTVQHPQVPPAPPPAPTIPIAIPPTRRRDPVAQSFFIDNAVYPSGIMLSSVDLFFSSKDTVLPVSVQIRPIVNGFPHSSEILRNGVVTLYPNQIKTSTLPDVSNTATATTFTFPSPLYLAPGQEYALVVITDSLEYNVYVSELGKQIIGSQRIVSTQPYLGSFFKSQNGSTWTPIQEEDLMFVLKKAVFTPGSTGTIDFFNQSPSYNINADSLFVHSSEDIYNNTSVSYTYSTNFGSTYSDITTKKTYDLDNRVVIGGPTDGLFRLRGSLRTNDRDISPVIYTEKMLVVGAENIINNLPVTNGSITIVNGGTGYTTPSTISVQFTSVDGAGSGANARVDTVSGGAVRSIFVDSPGSGYTSSPLIRIVGGTSGANANAVVASETSSDGGLARARYISRVVTLAEGFDAGDLRTYITAYKPSGTNVHLYYKIRNFDDPEPFSAKSWRLMSQFTPANQFSDDETDLIEYEFRASPNTSVATYTSGSTTYSTFNQFAIKIVLTSATTTVHPVVYDMRAIALASFGV